MAKHTLKILQQMLQDFLCVFDHFVATENWKHWQEMGEYIQFFVESLRKFRCKSPVMTLRLYHFGTLKSVDI